MENINEIYQMLNWHNNYGTQLHGMDLARELDDISLLIQPAADISIWDSCARVLYEKSDDILEPYLTELIEWIQDLNWPGALIILDRLKVFSGEKLKNTFIEIVENSINSGNEEGLKWLDNLSELLDNKRLKEELPNEILEILQKHYHNSSWWYEEK